jgi:hypothetical protein
MHFSQNDFKDFIQYISFIILRRTKDARDLFEHMKTCKNIYGMCSSNQLLVGLVIVLRKDNDDDDDDKDWIFSLFPYFPQSAHKCKLTLNILEVRMIDRF